MVIKTADLFLFCFLTLWFNILLRLYCCLGKTSDLKSPPWSLRKWYGHCFVVCRQNNKLINLENKDKWAKLLVLVASFMFDSFLLCLDCRWKLGHASFRAFLYLITFFKKPYKSAVIHCQGLSHYFWKTQIFLCELS